MGSAIRSAVSWSKRESYPTFTTGAEQREALAAMQTESSSWNGCRFSAIAQRLLVAQGFDRIQPRRFDGREQPEEDPDAGRETDTDGEGPPGQRHREAGKRVHHQAD